MGIINARGTPPLITAGPVKTVCVCACMSMCPSRPLTTFLLSSASELPECRQLPRDPGLPAVARIRTQALETILLLPAPVWPLLLHQGHLQGEVLRVTAPAPWIQHPGPSLLELLDLFPPGPSAAPLSCPVYLPQEVVVGRAGELSLSTGSTSLPLSGPEISAAGLGVGGQ